MHTSFFENKNFSKINYTTHLFPKGEYEDCTFSTCDFSNTDLSKIKFTSCDFHLCNLSMAVNCNTAFKGIAFTNSKMLGLRFDLCSTMAFEIAVDDCILNHSSFYKLKLKNILFKSSHFKDIDFTECDLSGAIFDNCILQKSYF